MCLNANKLIPGYSGMIFYKKTFNLFEILCRLRMTRRSSSERDSSQATNNFQPQPQPQPQILSLNLNLKYSTSTSVSTSVGGFWRPTPFTSPQKTD